MVCTDLKRQIEELRKENLDLKFEIDLTMKRLLLKIREIGYIQDNIDKHKNPGLRTPNPKLRPPST